MHDVLVVVFDNEAKADAGKTQLLHMDNDGTISITGTQSLRRKTTGPLL